MARTRRKRSPPSPRQQRERGAKSVALERGLTRDRGDSFSPFASRPLRNRFAHYPPPPGEEDPSVANDPQRSSVDGEDASSGSTHQDGEESEEDNVPADAAAQHPLAGNVIPDVAQDLDQDVVFDGVDGELVVANAEAEQPLEGVMVRDEALDEVEDTDVRFKATS